METALRIASPRDWEDFKTVRLRALADSPTSFAVTLAEVIAQPDAAWRYRLEQPDPTIIAYIGETPVGMGGLFAPEGANDAFIWGMWVAPEARDQGIGQDILRALLERAAGLGRTVLLHVTEGNDGARRLYEANGFVSTGEWEPLREGSRLRVEALRHGAAC